LAEETSTVVKVVGVALLLIIVAVAGIVLVMPALVCLGRACLSGGGSYNPVTGQTVYNIYVDVLTTRYALGQVVLTPQIEPTAPVGGTGELQHSCQWIFCAIDGVSVSATVSAVNQATGSSALSGTWPIRLGLNDHEEYVWQIPNAVSGTTYLVTVTEQVQTFTAGLKTITSTATISVPLVNVVQMPQAST